MAVQEQLGSIVESIKSKVVRSLKKMKNPYARMDRSSSIKTEIRKRRARRLIDETLRAADNPGKRAIPA